MSAPTLRDEPRYAGSQSVTLSEIISALSFALDLTEGARPGHALRCCLLGMRLAREVGLAGTDRVALYYALLLKDVGCSSNASRLCQVFAADERVVKRQFKFIDRQKLGRPTRDAVSFVWNNVAPGTSSWNRIRQIARMLRSVGDLTRQMIETRCERDGEILRKFGMGEPTCDAVYALDEQWNGQGHPRRLSATEIPLLARICGVAQHLDLFCSEYGPERALETLRERSGTWFDPGLVRAARSLARRKELWTWCLPSGNLGLLRSVVMGLDPGSSAALAASDIDLICSGFADVVDAKSSFTFRHSVGVAEAAVLIAEKLGLGPDRVATVRRAALLHDIGKLSVSNAILDKTGPLDAGEWALLREHPGVSREILARIGAFAEIAQLAGEHHEKLDGTGYPHRRMGCELSLESRILGFADVFGALMESRPYRRDLTPAEVKVMLGREVPHRLDGDCFDVISPVLDDLARTTTAPTIATGECPLTLGFDTSAVAI